MNKILIKSSIVIALLLNGLIVSSPQAAIRQYAAEVENSNWRLASGTRLDCTLVHEIPGYGKALFTSVASKQLNMEFELDMFLLPDTYDVAGVYSVPPRWLPGAVQRTIAEIQLRKQFDGDLPKKAAWTMLSELEKGNWPTIHYQDWYNDNDKISVALNAANFTTVYHNFAECVSRLLPFGFEDIAYTVLNYKLNSTELTKASERRLAMISEYLRQDSDMELVLVDGYSDSIGGRFKNKELSIERAVETKVRLRNMGVTSNIIEVTGHGERRHIAQNNRELTRGQNRRVVIRMEKP
jgi:outer membrane protein OmpA-like peptidoglycan-associated protein